MAQRIEVPGMGVVEFPDGMNDEQISAAIKRNIYSGGGTPDGPWRNYQKPVTDPALIQQLENGQGQRTYTIGLPDGRKLDIQAADEATAIRGAQEWHGNDIGRIKRNIGKMIDQGAPEAEIDTYLASEKVSPDYLRASAKGGTTLNIDGQRVRVSDDFLKLSPEQQNATVDEIARSLKQGKSGPWDAYRQPSTAEDVTKSAGVGVAKGTIGLAGMAGDAQRYGPMLAGWLARKAGMSEDKAAALEQWLPVPSVPVSGGASTLLRKRGLPESADIQQGVESVTGPFYKPQTTAGEYAQTVGEFAPAALAGPGGVGRRMLVGAALPGVGSEAAGQAVRNNRQWGPEYETAARIGGAVLAGGVLPSVAGRIVTPLPSSAARRDAVEVLREAGVEPTAGQVTGRKGLQYFEAERGGAAAQAAAERTGEQFTGAVLRTTGENAPRAIPEVMAGMRDRLVGTFRDLSARNQMLFDQQFANDVADVSRTYARKMPSQQREIVGAYLQDLTNAAQHPPGGISMLPGDIYQATRSDLSRHANAVRNSDPQLSNALRGLRDALDNAMDRSIQLINPADAGAWREARRQYGNMKAVERGASAAGENAAMGIISPQQMRPAIASGNNRGAYARGEGDLAELVRAGNAVLQPLPNSGTPGRMMAQNLGAGISSGIGALLGSSAGGPAGGAAGALVGALAPAAAGRLAMTRPVQAYLGNQVAAPFIEGLSPMQQALAASLMATMADRQRQRDARR